MCLLHIVLHSFQGNLWHQIFRTGSADVPEAPVVAILSVAMYYVHVCDVFLISPYPLNQLKSSSYQNKVTMAHCRGGGGGGSFATCHLVTMHPSTAHHVCRPASSAICTAYTTVQLTCVHVHTDRHIVPYMCTCTYR